MEKQRKALVRAAVVTVIATVSLLALGNIVTTTGSGLGCGDDWPHCNGKVIPHFFDHTVVIEYGHRVLAGLVSIAAATAAFFAWRIGGAERKIAMLGLVLLFIQIMLGAFTVWLELPPAVVIAHLACSMLFFGSFVWLALQTLVLTRTEPFASTEGNKRWLPAAIYTTAALVFTQIVVGGWMRHAQAGLACPDVPLCNGQIIPNLDGIIAIHFLHRALGVSILTILTLLAIFADRVGANASQKGIFRVITVVIWLQVLLGYLSVYTGLSVTVTTIHMIGAAILWAKTIVLVHRTYMGGQSSTITQTQSETKETAGDTSLSAQGAAS